VSAARKDADAPSPLRVYNRRHGGVPADAVYVGRPTRYGNPFEIGRDGTREEVVDKFEKYLLGKPELLERATRELFGRSLVCWCAPERCHADVLLHYVSGVPR
jgi:hypothetical protein